jgi:CysZ protein
MRRDDLRNSLHQPLGGVLGSPLRGADYLRRGLRMLWTPGIRPFVLIPLLINTVIFAALTKLGFEQFSEWIDAIVNWLPSWLQFLKWILWPLSLVLLIIVGAYTFGIVANFIGAPFNGLLAEKVESLLTNTHNLGGGALDALRDLPRVLGKELSKLLGYLPLLLLVFILSLLIYPAAPLLWFGLGAWMMALQYGDYPMDNHRYSLAQVKRELQREPLTSLGFGGAVMLGSMVPILNFLIMPAAVCGATIYWVERLQQQPDFGGAFSGSQSARTPASGNLPDHL